MGSLSVVTEQGDRVVSITLSGEFDLASAERVEAELQRIEQKAPEALLLNLEGLEFIDSSGLRVVLAAADRAQGAGRRFAITRGPEAVQRVLRITGVEDRLEVVADASALQALE